MLARGRALGPAFGALVLASRLAAADEAAPAPPVPPAEAVVADASDPVCETSIVRCGRLDGGPDAPSAAIEQTKAVGPTLRELRRCLNREGFTAVPAAIKITWAGDAPTFEVARGLDTHKCILQAKERLAAVRSPTPMSLSCIYECRGAVLAPPPVVAPPPARPVETAPPPPPPPPPVAPSPASVSGPPPALPLTTEPPPEPTEARSSPSRWYGWQTLLVDAAAAGILAGGLVSWTVEPTVIGYGGFLFGAPVVHAVHGNYGRMLASFALRLIVPALAGAIGAGLSLAGNSGDPTVKQVVTSAGIGIGVAAGACIVVDLALLGWNTGPERSSQNHDARGTY